MWVGVGWGVGEVTQAWRRRSSGSSTWVVAGMSMAAAAVGWGVGWGGWGAYLEAAQQRWWVDGPQHTGHLCSRGWVGVARLMVAAQANNAPFSCRNLTYQREGMAGGKKEESMAGRQACTARDTLTCRDKGHDVEALADGG